jgi:hypothetical protein
MFANPFLNKKIIRRKFEPKYTAVGGYAIFSVIFFQ